MVGHRAGPSCRKKSRTEVTHPREASYRSATIQAKTDAARRMTIEYDVQAMPSFVVDGRYITSSNMTSSVMEVLSVVDELIVLARNKQLGQTDQQ